MKKEEDFIMEVFRIQEDQLEWEDFTNKVMQELPRRPHPFRQRVIVLYAFSALGLVVNIPAMVSADWYEALSHLAMVYQEEIIQLSQGINQIITSWQ